jgi:phosphoadenosine phosphosulfate reductase
MWKDRVQRIHQHLEGYRSAGKTMFVSSSFQTHSIPLLHILASWDPTLPVYFLHTGFHFPETLTYRDTIAQQLGIEVRNIASPVSKMAQRDAQGRFFFTSDPDRCCYLNKVLPLEPLLMQYDVWISGVRRGQTSHRNALAVEEPGAHNTLRYHPILDWTSKDIFDYRKAFDLPEHPLDAQGYLSIGCAPCTRKFDPHLGERSGRWQGQTKEECGIHTEFNQK